MLKGFPRNFRRSWKILEIQQQKYKYRGESGRFNYSKYFENHKSYLNAPLILQDVRFLFRGAKYFACFRRFLSAKR